MADETSLPGSPVNDIDIDKMSATHSNNGDRTDGDVSRDSSVSLGPLLLTAQTTATGNDLDTSNKDNDNAEEREAVGRTATKSDLLNEPDGRPTVTEDNALEDEDYSSSESEDNYFRDLNMDKASCLSTTSLYEVYSKKLKDDNPGPEHRKKKAPKLVKSFIDYLQALESRVEKLEASEPMTSTGPTEPIEETVPVYKDVRTNNDQQPNQLSVESRFYRHDIDTSRVLYESNEGAQALLKIAYVPLLGKEVASCGPKGELEPSPDGIRINLVTVRSEYIARFIQVQTNFAFPYAEAMEISRPFKLLIRYAGSFKEQLQVLEAKQTSISQSGAEGNLKPAQAGGGTESEPGQPKDTAGTDAPAAPGIDLVEKGSASNKGAEEIFHKPEAHAHFKLLVEFIEHYLASQVDKLATFRKQERSQVAFEDLWMLFDFGDTICCRSRKSGIIKANDVEEDEEAHVINTRDTPQAYRVVATLGGVSLDVRPTRKSDEQAEGASPSLPTRAKDLYNPFLIECYYLDCDGVRYDCVAEKFCIKPYEDEVDVTSLEAFPIGFDQHLSVDFFTKRGTKFLEHSALFSHRQYESLTVGENPEEINSPVIIDFVLAFQDGRRPRPKFGSPSNIKRHKDHQEEIRGPESVPVPAICSRPGCEICASMGHNDFYLSYQRDHLRQVVSRLKDTIELYQQHESPVTPKKTIEDLMRQNDHLILLPGVVYGFALRHRRWVDLDLTKVDKFQANSGFDDLVLPKGHQKMVLSMVYMHASGSRTAIQEAKRHHEQDLVKGKGKGMIILLHGEPGVGKTSTAECVAAHTERPLFPITCGDIGHNATDVEKNLDSHFNLAHKWGCVLLLDEADVFLEKRSKSDLERNGVVSVFLRILEYYPGILFLTTNRVGSFDPGFRSRIHLSLFYPALDRTKTMKIWETNLKRTEENNEKRAKHGLKKIKFDRYEIMDFAGQNWETLSWNGRQIRNAFQTSLALAEFDVEKTTLKKDGKRKKSPVMSSKHFYTVAQASLQFDKYLVETHKGKEGDVAERDGVRVSEFIASTAELKLPGAAEVEEESSDSGTDA